MYREVWLAADGFAFCLRTAHCRSVAGIPYRTCPASSGADWPHSCRHSSRGAALAEETQVPVDDRLAAEDSKDCGGAEKRSEGKQHRARGVAPVQSHQDQAEDRGSQSSQEEHKSIPPWSQPRRNRG